MLAFLGFQYGYDRNSNRLYEKNLVDGAFSELYHANGASNGYDKLNQIAEFRRGTLSDANSDGVLDTITTSSRTQVWDYDPLGNWNSVTNDGTAQNRTHNRQNQITSITSLTTPSYDLNGNMTGDENGKTLVYDAWNRLVDFKNGGTSLEAYKYDAMNRRIEENPGTARALFYTAEWQIIEERTSGVARVSNVWSPVYIDALIVRDRDSDTNGSLDERLYVAHDANWNVSSILNTSATVQERYVYDPFGTPSFKDASYGARGSSSFSWTRLYQGQSQSGSTGLSSFRTRWQSGTQGRFTSNDSWGYDAGDSNLNRFVSNNPLHFIDPFGNVSLPSCGPDVTTWFAVEIKQFLDAVRELIQQFKEDSKDAAFAGGDPGPAIMIGSAFESFLLKFMRLSRLADYKMRPFQLAPNDRTGCKDPDAGTDEATVTLCGVCIKTNQLGNIMFGIIAAEAGLIDLARSYGRGIGKLIGMAPKPDWTMPGQQYRQEAFELGVDLMLARKNPRLGLTLCDFVKAREGRIRQGRYKLPCTCGGDFTGPNTDMKRDPLTDAAGNRPQ